MIMILDLVNNYIENRFYLLPITNNEIINTKLNMKSKSSKDINNYDVTLIKLLIHSIAKTYKKKIFI